MRPVRMVWLAGLVIASACTGTEPARPAAGNTSAPALIEIPAAPDQVGEMSDVAVERKLDLDAILERGYIRILVAPSRTHLERSAGRMRGRTVDAAVALAKAMSERGGRHLSFEFVGTSEELLVSDLLAGRGDVAANVLLTFERNEQVVFAPPIRTGIRELVVTRVDAPLVSLEDVGGRAIHVRENGEHHNSLLRLNRQLKAINRPPARVVVETLARTDEELLERVNRGAIPATIVDDFIFERWRAQLPNTAANRDIAVSQDGVLAWVSRKDTPQLGSFMQQFFSTHKLTF